MASKVMQHLSESPPPMRQTPTLTLLVLLATGAVPSLAASPAPPSLAQAVHGPGRTARFVARDPARHPAEELAFFGITPHANVVEIWPGGGYWTEILAPYLYAQGTYTLALPGNVAEEVRGTMALRARLAADPATYGHVRFNEHGHARQSGARAAQAVPARQTMLGIDIEHGHALAGQRPGHGKVGG